MLKITISTKNPDGSPASSYTSTQVSGETPLGAITRTMREAADAFESEGFEAANQLAVEVATV